MGGAIGDEGNQGEPWVGDDTGRDMTVGDKGICGSTQLGKGLLHALLQSPANAQPILTFLGLGVPRVWGGGGVCVTPPSPPQVQASIAMG